MERELKVTAYYWTPVMINMFTLSGLGDKNILVHQRFQKELQFFTINTHTPKLNIIQIISLNIAFDSDLKRVLTGPSLGDSSSEKKMMS